MAWKTFIDELFQFVKKTDENSVNYDFKTKLILTQAYVLVKFVQKFHTKKDKSTTV